jgi:hypothetical protein
MGPAQLQLQEMLQRAAQQLAEVQQLVLTASGS